MVIDNVKAVVHLLLLLVEAARILDSVFYCVFFSFLLSIALKISIKEILGGLFTVMHLKLNFIQLCTV